MTKKSSYLPAITVFTAVFLILFAVYTFLAPQLLQQEFAPEEISLTPPQEVSGIYDDRQGAGQQTEQTSQPQRAPQGGQININTASEEELCEIVGVGPATAKKIIEYRNTSGLFSSTEEICLVNGIGKVKYEKMKESICIE